MNRILLVLTFALSTALAAWGAASKSTVDFLQKLNGYYYCLSKEGLKSYHCELSCGLSAASQKELESQGLYEPKLWGALKSFHLSMDDGAGRPLSIVGTQAPKTGDAALDARVDKLNENILEAARTFSQFWKGFVVEPLNDPNDVNQGNLKFQKETNGFKVIQGDASSGMTGSFDMKGKLLELSAQGEAGPTTVKPDFIYSQKGYLLRGISLHGPQVEQSCRLAYGVQGRYWLPKALTVRVRLPGLTNADIELDFTFSNYKVSP